MRAGIRVGTAIAAVMMIGVAGCAAGGGDAYCGDLKAATDSFSALGAQDYAKIDRALDTYHELAKEAPAKVKDDWKAVDDLIASLQAALKDAGLELKDLGTLQSGKLPDGLDMAGAQKLSEQMSKIDATKVAAAAQNITTHAKDTCKISLGK